MSIRDRWIRCRSITLKTAAVGFVVCLVAGIASSQTWPARGASASPEGEFHLARMIYSTFRIAGSRPGVRNPMWAVDYPYADFHFLQALRRLTTMSVADAVGDGRRHLEMIDDRIFQYPFLWMQQPGSGNWNPAEEEVVRLREYLLRGGFLFVDDFHGQSEWFVFQRAIQRVFPDRPIIPIPQDDPLMSIFFDLNQSTEVPGARHVRYWPGSEPLVRMQGPPAWRGIYDDQDRLMVGINFNMDVGDAWEHADDPYYPAPMTVEAYRLGINYIIYAMTH